MRRGRQGRLVNQGWEGLASSCGATAPGKKVADEWGAAIGEKPPSGTVFRVRYVEEKGGDGKGGVMQRLLALEVPCAMPMCLAWYGEMRRNQQDAQFRTI